VYECLKDTFLQGKDCKVIRKIAGNGDYPVPDAWAISLNYHPGFVCYTEANKIFYWHPYYQKFGLWFDFNALQGDTIPVLNP